MDRRVKERLIGASILVALIVLVVPELLSGSKSALPEIRSAIAPQATRNVTLDLATSKPPANSDAEPAGTGSSPASVVSAIHGGEASVAPTVASSIAGSPSETPAASSSAASSNASPSNAASSSTARQDFERGAAPLASAHGAAPPAPAPVETAALSPISSRAGWAVQLGSFASRSNADNLSRQVKGQGFSVYVLPGGAGASVRYRVRVGPLADRDSAERTAAKLKSIGHVASLVAPTG
jgi:DedD protein